ncbi:MAG: Crp/Fnr family transcriptional regulator [Bradyrhizobium sp.]
MQRDNLLLGRLDRHVLEKVSSALAFVELEQGQLLADQHHLVEKVYFPCSCILSCVVELPGGGAIETGMIGKDGQWGASQALDNKVSLNNVVVQVAGRAAVMAAGRLKLLAKEFPSFQTLLLRYDQFSMAQMQQTAACNAVHAVEPRFCRWLLRMHELVGPNISITQEFMAQMMGVRRTSVTQIAIGLQKAGAISYTRGKVHITDLSHIQSHSCECPGELVSHYDRLFGAE